MLPFRSVCSNQSALSDRRSRLRSIIPGRALICDSLSAGIVQIASGLSFVSVLHGTIHVKVQSEREFERKEGSESERFARIPMLELERSA